MLSKQLVLTFYDYKCPFNAFTYFVKNVLDILSKIFLNFVFILKRYKLTFFINTYILRFVKEKNNFKIKRPF